MTNFSKKSDEYIIAHAYHDLKFIQIAKKLDRTIQSIYQHTYNIFGIPVCRKHQHFHSECDKCKNQLKIWKMEALNIIEKRNYDRKNIEFFTREEDKFIIQNSYDKMFFSEIARKLERSTGSISTHIYYFFESPRCENHDYYKINCEKCQETLKSWRERNLEKINKKLYPDEKEKTKSNLSIYIKRRRNLIIEKNYEYLTSLANDKIFFEVVDFINEHIDMTGQSMEDIFKQSLRIFLNDYLSTYNYSKGIPKKMFGIFSSICPNMSTMKNLLISYKKFFNPEFKPFSSWKRFFLADLIPLTHFFREEDIINHLFQIIAKIYRRIDFYSSVEVLISAFLYNFLKTKKNKKSQIYISDNFNTTQTTLRTRGKLIRKLKKKRIFKSLFQELNQKLNIIPLKSDLKKKSKLKIKNLQKMLKKLDLHEIPIEIKTNILSELSELLQLKKNIQENKFKSLIKNFLMVEDPKFLKRFLMIFLQFEYYEEFLKKEFVILLGSENKIIIKLIINLLSKIDSSLKNKDVYEILECLNNEEKIKIRDYIKKSRIRKQKSKFIFHFIENSIKNN